MKKVAILLTLVLSCSSLFSQEVEKCRQIVERTIEAINVHSSEGLNQYLSEDFSIAGQEGAIAEMILSQLLSQLQDSVLSSEEDGTDRTESSLILKYNLIYEKKGEEQATFVFNDKSELEELKLFDMEIKKVSGDAEVTKTNKTAIEIPFEMAGNLILVEVMLNGEERRFLLDSGAPKVILNANYVTQDSSRIASSSTKGVNGSISGMNVAEGQRLDFFGLEINNQDLITMNLSHLEEELGQEFYGLIGFDLIKDYDLLFDYENRLLTLISPETFETYRAEKLSEQTLQTIPIELKGHIPVVELQIADKVYRMGIDSGAESNLFHVDHFDSLEALISNLGSDDLKGAGEDHQTVKTADIAELQIGEKTFNNTRAIFSDISHLNEGYKLNVDGLIGYPILSAQKTLLSFHRGELSFIN